MEMKWRSLWALFLCEERVSVAFLTFISVIFIEWNNQSLSPPFKKIKNLPFSLIVSFFYVLPYFTTLQFYFSFFLTFVSCKHCNRLHYMRGQFTSNFVFLTYGLKNERLSISGFLTILLFFFPAKGKRKIWNN